MWGSKSAAVDYIGLIAYLIKSNQEIYEELQTTKTTLEEHTHSDLEERLKADLQTVKTQLQTTNEQNQKLEARIAFLETALISR